MEITQIRTDADLYGYSKWLAGHLGYKITPRSLRSFQHGWIWWDHTDMPYVKGCGIDINVDDYWGVLVQDDNVRDHLLEKGIYAKTCGLPFVSFLEHSGLKGMMGNREPDSLLYVPAHSNPWNNLTEDIIANAKKFALNSSKKCSIMLSWNDRHAAPLLRDHFHKIEIGAGALEDISFYRLIRIFESYEYMITDSPGSHICYALLCGMRVGIHSELFNLAHEGEQGRKTVDVQRAMNSNFASQMLKICSLEYMEKKYPGIVISNNRPNYNIPPDIKAEQPHLISDSLGWNTTYQSDLISNQAKNQTATTLY